MKIMCLCFISGPCACETARTF